MQHGHAIKPFEIAVTVIGCKFKTTLNKALLPKFEVLTLQLKVNLEVPLE